MCDDSCHLVRLSFLRYPNESNQIYGDLKGCFEAPSPSVKPSSSVDCPDILPLSMIDSNQCVNREAMNDPNPLNHPDSNSVTRYCLGTKLHKHKSPTCAYHDASLATQGHFLKTMTQEALQNCRKFRTIQVWQVELGQGLDNIQTQNLSARQIAVIWVCLLGKYHSWLSLQQKKIRGKIKYKILALQHWGHSVII